MSILEARKKVLEKNIDTEKSNIKRLAIAIKNIHPVVFDLANIGDVDSLINYLDSDQFLDLPNFPHRYRRGITLWKKSPSKQQHFMHDTCNTNEKYMDTPVEDLYDKSIYQQRLMRSGFLDAFANHKVVIEKENLFAITYTESNDEDLIVDITTLHPHCITHTVHEMFKALLEWQWAYCELGSEEPMAVFCNEVLVSLGLNYKDEETNPVIKSLISLPDMYIAQFLAGNPVIRPSITDPEEPLEFKLWSSKMGMYSYKRSSCNDIYEACLKVKILQKKLLQI